MSQVLERLAVKRLVGLESPEDLQKIKDFVSEVYLNAGYSNSPWKNIDYDPWSIWFYVEGEGGILCAMRIVEKYPWNFIPLEVALIHGKKNGPSKRYAVIEENVADWNGVAFVQTREAWVEAKKTFRAVAQFCLERNYDMVYGMYPLELVGIAHVYLNAGAVISKKYVGPMYFPEFNLKGEECLLNVIEIGKGALQEIASKTS
ncbi:hypothetical protein AB3N59_15060 [Leptospira sp. WS92.C1]